MAAQLCAAHAMQQTRNRASTVKTQLSSHVALPLPWSSLVFLSSLEAERWRISGGREGTWENRTHLVKDKQTHPLSEIRDILDHMTHYALPSVFVASKFLEITGEALRYILCAI